jgi:type I restriction-modification system DNA methylase subunit
VEGVSFLGRSIGEIAWLLGKKHSLMGRALTVLTDQPEDEHSVALATMIRVLSVVDWADFPDDSYPTLYEKFLAEYDPVLRRKSGIYYTPAPLVSFMTRFVDDILRERLGRRLGFAERDVIVVDPAMGTGSFLADVINTVATTVAAEEGVGAVAPYLRELSTRLIGFENQAAPYAVAELRGLFSHRIEVERDYR